MLYFFKGMLIHGSPTNHGQTRRCGLTCSFITPSVFMDKLEYDYQYELDFRQPVLVRGEDKVGALKYAKTLEQMWEGVQEEVP